MFIRFLFYIKPDFFSTISFIIHLNIHFIGCVMNGGWLTEWMFALLVSGCYAMLCCAAAAGWIWSKNISYFVDYAVEMALIYVNVYYFSFDMLKNFIKWGNRVYNNIEVWWFSFGFGHLINLILHLNIFCGFWIYLGVSSSAIPLVPSWNSISFTTQRV